MSASVFPDALFFDVDGVLIDSVRAKGQAFAETFADVPDSRKAILDFHEENGGLTRSIKIRRLHHMLVGSEISESDLQERLRRYAKLSQDTVAGAPEIAGARATLEEWSDKCHLYAVSATPTGDLHELLESRRLAGLFDDIRGWPPSKEITLLELLRQGHLRPQRCALIGDSLEDLLASKSVGVSFIAFQPTPRRPIEGADHYISRFQQLPEALRHVGAYALS